MSFGSDTGWAVDPLGLALLLAFAAFTVFSIYRDRVRRRSLRQREDGTYVWIEWHGGERCSTTDPTEDWDADGGDGGGDGGGD